MVGASRIVSDGLIVDVIPPVDLFIIRGWGFRVRKGPAVEKLTHQKMSEKTLQ